LTIINEYDRLVLTIINLRSPVSRIQLALNVADLDAAVDFYSKLFDTPPAKRRPGYANFAVGEPPLKLVLIEGGGESGTINHLGIEVFSPEAVSTASARLHEAGLVTDVEHETTCCYAVQDKVWVSGPDGARWEVYTVLADASEATALGCATDACTPLATDDPASVGAVGASTACC
jgi:catechol 2,3-dioxygenase-like lactoylglutathione lyase family enzyme